jgi:hypothetical protein
MIGAIGEGRGDDEVFARQIRRGPIRRGSFAVYEIRRCFLLYP